VFSTNFIRDRFVEENRKEALYKVFSARKAFVNLLHGELQFYLGETESVEKLFASGLEPTRSVGNRRLVKLLRDASDAAAGDSVDVRIAGLIDEVSSDDLFLHQEGDTRYIGVVSEPVRVTGEGWDGTFRVYYARLVDSELLGEVAEQVSADVNVYDDGELVGSSREGLLAGGFISAIMNAEAFLEVSVLGSDHSLATERAGQYSYQVAYLPVAGWANRVISVAGEAGPGAFETNAAMSVPLLFRPESYYAEMQKATSVMLGIFALLFAATIGLGLVLARGIFEPLRALLAGTRRIADGDLDVKLPQRRRDEIGTVMTAFNEMTERVAESRRTLDERRRYLETILENIGTGVISTDDRDCIRTVNSAAQRILGVTEGKAVGRSAAELADDGIAPTIFSLLRGAAERDQPFVAGEVELATAGARSTVKYMLTRLQVDGRYLGTVFVFEDLTELIQSKKLSAWVEMARQIAHEIKNPLTPIRMETQFMQRAYEEKPDHFDKVFRESTETILYHVDVLKRIAGEFSSYGRMQQLEIGPHAVDPLVKSIITPYEKNNTGVVIAYENGAPAATVLVDPEAVRKICSNLIENALDAMPNGGELRVACDERVTGGQPYVRLSFRDTGPGLSAEASEKLFEPYFSTKTTGTGLGLAICRQLSREMGGDVTVRNIEEGNGVEASVTMRAKA
jgi:PAS domain S-box-containing protein